MQHTQNAQCRLKMGKHGVSGPKFEFLSNVDGSYLITPLVDVAIRSRGIRGQTL